MFFPVVFHTLITFPSCLPMKIAIFLLKAFTALRPSFMANVLANNPELRAEARCSMAVQQRAIEIHWQCHGLSGEYRNFYHQFFGGILIAHSRYSGISPRKGWCYLISMEDMLDSHGFNTHKLGVKHSWWGSQVDFMGISLQKMDVFNTIWSLHGPGAGSLVAPWPLCCAGDVQGGPSESWFLLRWPG